jgi:glycine/D-amino acid oxidase-like deaminating enzyme
MSRLVIIGCGVVGAAIAYELSKLEGLEITLIDRAAPASGSTGAALGVLMAAISQKVSGRAWQWREASLNYYATLLPELASLVGENIPHNARGIVLLRFEETDLPRWQKLQRMRRQQGWELQLWSRDRLTERCPHLALDRIAGAVYSPSDRQIHPPKLTQALVKAAQYNGVECRFRVSVEKLQTEGDCRIHIQTDGGRLTADGAVIAAGLGSSLLAEPLKADLKLLPVLGQAMRVRCDRPLERNEFQPVITGEDVHIVPLGGGDYWVGATVEFPDGGNEIVPQAELLEQVYERATAFCPELAEGKILNRWSGIRPRPEGEPAPIVRPLQGYPNILLATGHYRNGVLMAPATALAVRDWIASRG